MDLSTLLLVALALGADAFSLTVVLGLNRPLLKYVALVSLAVAGFHVLMPAAGIFLGSLVGRLVGQLGSFLGAAILIYLGAQMFFSRKGRLPFVEKSAGVYSGIWAPLVLAGSVSLDSLTVGFSLGAMGLNGIAAVMVIGLMAGLMSGSGFFVGSQIGSRWGQKAKMAGGLILIALGLKLLFW